VLQKAVDMAHAHDLAPRYNLALALWNTGQHTQARETAQAALHHAHAQDPLRPQLMNLLQAIAQAGANN